MVEALPGVYLLKERALWIPEMSALVIADVHLGYESGLFDEPFYPKMQIKELEERMESLMKRYRPERVIINGDLKHEFSSTPYSEFSEVRDFLNAMGDAKITLVRGNHDNFIAKYLKKRDADVVDTLELQRFFFFHGHKSVEIPEGKIGVMGHEHPILIIRDSIGAKASFPCFLVSDELILLPAFSEISGGTNVVGSREGFLSPIISSGEVNMEKTELFVISNENIEYIGKRMDFVKVHKKDLFIP